MTVYLFAYGTLMRRGRIEALVGTHLPEPRPAVLRGYRKYDTEHGYPVVLADPGGEVSGLLWEIDSGALDDIDHYEGVDHDPPLYARRLLPVAVDDEHVDAFVYVGNASAFTSLTPARD
ncbi:MAG TPA: gamma-glutamylcyclotransferase family protein [Bacillota bacterium]